MADYAIHDTTLIAQANILRKKFGTNDRQDPADYAYKMNLMGLLEEKTQASASVCAFSDGADDVPTKSLVVTIPPTLSGVSSVTETQTGKNLVDFNSHLESSYSDLAISGGADGSISFSGTPNRSWAHLTTDFDIDLPIGTYTLGRNASASYALYVAVRYTDGTTENFSMGSASSKTFTTTKKINRMRLDLSLLSTSTNYNETIFVMLEYGSTAHDYEPYQTPTTYTASLGRTIYGGQADIVNGTGTDENGNDFTFDGQEIPTRLGYNAFWSDEGDTEVTYRSSGTITPVLPTLISKTITENDTYLAEDDGADGYSEVIVNVSGGGGGSCERLFYARCYDNYQVEIPTISSLVQGTNYSSYVSYDTTTKKFTALQDFTAVIIGWVFTYQTYEASYSQGAFVVNNKRLATYTATGKTQGSTGGAYMVYNFKQGDEFYPYTPSTDGYPRQNCKVYLVSDLDDDIYTFADEEA